MRILVTGASGLVGHRLTRHLLGHGHQVVATSRNPQAQTFPDRVEAVEWDGERHLQVSGPIDAVVNLAGAGIMDKRWTSKRRKELVESRVRLTRHLAGFINALPQAKRPVLVNASAIGYYGEWPKGECNEQSPPGDDFLATLARDWEAAAAQAATRIVIFRFSHVMDASGGYLGKLLPLAKLGVAGPIGSGKQPTPWIHNEDLARAILWAIETPRAKGIYNAAAPELVDNRTFVKTLGHVLHRPMVVPVPALALRLRFGPAVNAIVGGQQVRPDRLLEEGFVFEYPKLKKALAALVTS